MYVTRKSMFTGRTHRIFIPGLTPEMIAAWKGGQLAQEAFKGLTPEMIEFIMTGVTPAEWSAAFGG